MPRCRAPLAMIVVVGCAAPATASASSPLLAPASVCPTTREWHGQVTCLVNYARRHNGRPPVRGDSRLTPTAQRKAADILRCQDFSHAACGRPWDFWIRMGQPGAAYAENIAWGSGPAATARSTMDRWLTSPGHLRNIENPRFTRLGVGEVTGTFLGYRDAAVWVQHFAG
jgi:uncharacterized protein YkwD